MSEKQVWYPERSFNAAQLGSEESGRGSLHASSSEQEPESNTGATKTRKKPLIPRRRTPTVCIPHPSGATNSATTNSNDNNNNNNNRPVSRSQAKPSYHTIEPSKGVTLQELSAKVYEQPNAPPPKNHNWFCGWTSHEHLDIFQSNKMPTADDVDRTRLQTPADGYRSSLHSRAGSSRYNSSRGRQRMCQYVFHHYGDTERHMEDYRNLYSYTALTTGSSLPLGEERFTFCNGEDVEQDDEVMLPIGVRSLYRGDPHLRELVHRLGIKEPPPPQDWDRPRPTPPSIVKKRRNRRDVDIVVSNSAPRKEETAQESDENDEWTSIMTHDDKGSWQDTKEESSSQEEGGVVELPKITRSSQISQLLQQIYQRNNKRKSNSVISIQKYLKVKSSNQETLTEEDDDFDEEETNQETEIPADKERTNQSRGSKVAQEDKERDRNPSHNQGSDETHTTPKTNHHHHSSKQDADKVKDVEFEHKNMTPSALDQSHLLSLTRGQKEKLLTNTAHALGVVSHDWAKMPGLRRMKTAQGRTREETGNSKDRHAGSPSRQSKSRAEYRNQTESRMGYRNQIATPSLSNKGNVKTDADSSKSKAPNKERSGPTDAKKIEKLKSIYDPSHHQSKSRSVHPSRQPSRCGSRHPSRPATRMQIYKTHHQELQQQIKGKQYSQSRPTTRMSYHHHKANRFPSHDGGNLESLEESTYWNELPPQEKAKKPADNSTTAAFGVVEHNKKSVDLAQFQKSLKVSRGWSEDLSHITALGKKKEGAQTKEAFTGTDKIAQAISLAMKFRKPRESLMRKLTGETGRGGVSKAVHQS